MTSRYTIGPSVEGVDVRTFVNTIKRYTWMILGLIVASAVAATVMGYLLISDSYESRTVISLPNADGKEGLGLSPQGYEALGKNTSALTSKKQRAGLGLGEGALADRYDVHLVVPDARVLSVSVSAETPQKALHLAQLWAEVYQEQTQALLQVQLVEQKAGFQEGVNKAGSELGKARDALAKFDLLNSISLLEARVSSMESALVDKEGELREVTLWSIPADKARLAFLEGALKKEPQTLSGPVGTIIMPGESSGAGVTSNEVIILNPVYLQLSKDIAETRTRQVANQQMAEALLERIPSLQADLDQARKRLITAEAERQVLERYSQEVGAVYQSSETQLEKLLVTEMRLPLLSRVDVVREPEFPEGPVGPKRVLSTVLGGLLGAVLGMAIALVRDWYRLGATGAVPLQQKATTVQATRDNRS